MKKGPIFGAPNFTYEEFLRSDTALREGIQNIPDKDCVWCNMEYLAREVLQPVRDKFGPIRVTSGYRSAALNKVIPGSSATSHHCSGSAADIEPVRKDVSLRDIFSFIATELPFTELIAENLPDGWVHVALVRGREDERAVKFKRVGGLVRRSSYGEVMAMSW